MKLVDSDGAEYALDQDEITIGRSSSNTITLSDPLISGKHAVITRSADTYTLEDLNSTNGTKHNGDLLVGLKALQPGDVITFGSLELRVVSEGEPAATIAALEDEMEAGTMVDMPPAPALAAAVAALDDDGWATPGEAQDKPEPKRNPSGFIEESTGSIFKPEPLPDRPPSGVSAPAAASAAPLPANEQPSFSSAPVAASPASMTASGQASFPSETSSLPKVFSTEVTYNGVQKDRGLALAIDILPGLFMALPGGGWIYVGDTTRGLITMAAGFFGTGAVAAVITVLAFATLGFGSFCYCVLPLIPILVTAYSAYSLNEYIKAHPEQFK